MYAGQKQTTFEKYYEYLHMIEKERDGAEERERERGEGRPHGVVALTAFGWVRSLPCEMRCDFM